ncbi:Signal transduction histidine kinase [Ornithinimicrobium cerasi]|uniref:histidine kinase n=1 Tax=Ornithinimicrobium cerasi TaxID=2248773 RepID=A0A285VD34_9MICO|nr:Signal transduction histidine kinase [Ornithinimicrobium cerasi]
MALALLLAVGGLLELALTDLDPARPAAAVGLSLLGAAAMLLRTPRPLACLLVTVVLVVLAHVPALGMTLTGTLVVAFLLALASVGRHVPDRVSLAAVLGSATLFVVGSAFVGRPWDVVVALMACAAAWTAGRLLRGESRRSARLSSLADELTTQQEQRTREAVQGERMRVARELHDSVAHLVSVMTLHTGGIRRRLDDDPERQEERDALLEVERLGREAVGELHRILGVLRTDDEPATSGVTSPQPRLADLPQLVARVAAAGVPVELAVDGEEAPLSPGAELAAYRVVQEALTNVLKHGGGAPTRVRVTYGPADVEVLVQDDGRAAGPGIGASTGLGLAGIRERVALHGGRVEAGQTSAGFRVRATLPVGGDA